MASSEDYLEYCLGQLEDVANLTTKKMMGEYLIYVDGILVGGIYDDRLLLKPTEAGKKLMPQAESVLPYDGAKSKLLLVECVDEARAVSEAVEATADALRPSHTSK